MARGMRAGKILVLSAVVVGALAAGALAEVDPVAVEVRYQNGVKFFKRGLYDRASQEFEKTLALDPANEDAKEYLEQIAALKDKGSAEGAASSGKQELKSLYEEAKALYAKKDFEGASGVFGKILAINPVDEYASFYKERCEIYLSRDLTKKAKIEEKERLKQQKEQDRIARQQAKEAKAAEREQMLRKRAEIDEQRREARREKVATVAVSAPEAVAEPAAAAEEEKPDQLYTPDKAPEAQPKKASAREESLARKEQARQEKIRAAEERKRAKEELRQQKIAAKQEAREEKKADARWSQVERMTSEQEKAQARQKKVAEKKQTQAERESVKMLYIQAVQQYAERDYEEAIKSFEAVIEAERGGTALYSGSAGRLIEKARKKQELMRKKVSE